MIQRFVFVKLLDHEVATRVALAARLRAELVEAGADVTVGVPADDSAVRWDLSIVIEAASLAAWEALAAHAAVIAALADIATRAAIVKAWSFEVQGQLPEP